MSSVTCFDNVEVQRIIDKGRKSEDSRKCLKDIFTQLQNIVGPKECWGVYELYQEHLECKISYDTAIERFFRMKTIVYGRDVDENSKIDLTNQMINEEMSAYRKGIKDDEYVVDKTLLKRVFEEEIYRYVIFFSENKERFMQPSFVRIEGECMSQSAEICEKMLLKTKKTDFSLTEKVKWWMSNRDNIYSCLNELRCKTVKGVMNCFVCKYRYFLLLSDKDKRESPFYNFLGICESSDEFADEFLTGNVDLDAYKELLEVAFSQFYKKGRFVKLMKENLLSKIITIPEEAFALLCMENNFKRWSHAVQQSIRNLEDDRGSAKRICTNGGSSSETSKVSLEKFCGLDEGDKVPPLLYQRSKKVRKDGKNGAGSYTNEGKARLNYLIDKVAQVREERKETEETLRSMFFSNFTKAQVLGGWINTNSYAKRKDPDENEKEIVFVKNCLSYAEV